MLVPIIIIIICSSTMIIEWMTHSNRMHGMTKVWWCPGFANSGNLACHGEMMLVLDVHQAQKMKEIKTERIFVLTGHGMTNMVQPVDKILQKSYWTAMWKRNWRIMWGAGSQQVKEEFSSPIASSWGRLGRKSLPRRIWSFVSSKSVASL